MESVAYVGMSEGVTFERQFRELAYEVQGFLAKTNIAPLTAHRVIVLMREVLCEMDDKGTYEMRTFCEELEYKLCDFANGEQDEAILPEQVTNIVGTVWAKYSDLAPTWQLEA